MKITAALGVGDTPLQRALSAVTAHTPYLKRLATQRVETMATLAQNDGFAAAIETATTAARTAADAATFEDGMRALRLAKQDLHLALGVFDLTGMAPVTVITRALSDFADAALSTALTLAERSLRETGALTAPVRGLSVFAMGKLGARELNYSSDVDLIVVFAPNWLACGERLEPSQAGVRLTQLLVRAMHETTEDGYVFRTDLRLRPDPGSTPVAVTFAAAERYYQSVGENWERAAFIKARVCAGDVEMGDAFLASLRPFIWRRHLDYAAIDDIRSVQRQIHRFHGSAPLDSPVFDVKLARGGIRDIELFVQTQQLIRGGRDASLRTPSTLDALTALEAAGVLSAVDRAAFAHAYEAWRAIEHRIQMRDDEHTHDMPSHADARAHIAAMCGYDRLEMFDAATVALRARVVQLCEDCGTTIAERTLPRVRAIGGDQDAQIDAGGFAEPEAIRARLAMWEAGGIRAVRSARAMALLKALLPSILALCANQQGKDATFAAFATFLEGLPAGVQVLSLLEARPDVLVALVALFAVAPLRASDLAQRPTLLDAMSEPRFFEAIGGEAAGLRVRALQAIVSENGDFEAVINAVRRYHREEHFRITTQILRRMASPRAAGGAYSDLAEACVNAIAGAARTETERQFGKEPGRHVVLALGKFAGGELTASSDLDMMLIYDAEEGARSAGPRTLGPIDFYSRLTQRFISGLSAPTEEGLLYDVDMQLRPSGAKGPVAVRLSSFDRYYREEAWTWELLALTRARVVSGDEQLARKVMESAAGALTAARDRAKVLADVAAMRGRLDREKPALGVFDIKRAQGGIVDIEFIAQALQLCGGARSPMPNTAAALTELAKSGALSADEERTVRGAFDVYTDVQQILRAASMDARGVATAPPAFQALAAACANVDELDELAGALHRHQCAVREIFLARIGETGDGSTPLAR